MCDVITVKSQEELNQIPIEFKGVIYVEFGSLYVPAHITEVHPHADIIALENSVVTALGNSTVTAWNNSTVIARDNSTVTAWYNADITARDNSTVISMGKSTVTAYENSNVTAHEYSSVTAQNNARIIAWENASVIARENSTVIAHGNSTVIARENSTVTARENSTVTARENSTVTAWGNPQICDITENHSISVNGNARIVYMPRNGTEYCDFYDLSTHDGVGVFYKAVRKKDDGTLVAYYDHNFQYKVGTVSTADFFDNDPTCACSRGIHMAYLDWAYQFGAGWDNLAIIEVEAKLDDIVVPPAAGKVRAPSVKVIREVPSEEYEKLLGIRR